MASSEEPREQGVPDEVFEAAFASLVEHLERRYGVAVEQAGVPPPFKGDLDGIRIIVGLHCSAEEKLFLVAHLFGHTVQWNTSEASRRLGMAMPVDPDEAELDALEAYEQEACRYSQQAMHEAGLGHLDQWLADYSACDLAYLRHFYRTGERRAFDRFHRSGMPRLTPLPLPRFSPRAWRKGVQAIVI